MNGHYFLWLVPEEPYFTSFLSVISDLSRLFEGVSFLPHVTFCTSDNPDIFDLAIPSIEIQIQDICHSDAFFQSIYLSLNSQKLEDLRSQIAHKYKIPPQPHLSLFYGELTRTERHDICSSLQVDVKQCTLSKKVLVYGKTETSHGYSNVRSWQIIKTEVLR